MLLTPTVSWDSIIETAQKGRFLVIFKDLMPTAFILFLKSEMNIVGLYYLGYLSLLLHLFAKKEIFWGAPEWLNH